MSNAQTHTITPVLTLSPAFHWLRAQGTTALAGLSTTGRAVWRVLAAQGQQRAQREMMMLADRWQRDNPKLARELRAYARGASTY